MKNKPKYNHRVMQALIDNGRYQSKMRSALLSYFLSDPLPDKMNAFVAMIPRLSYPLFARHVKKLKRLHDSMVNPLISKLLKSTQDPDRS